MGIGIVRQGSWTLSSKKDKRWNCSGGGFVGGLEMPKELKEKIERLKKEFGRPPDDLEWTYVKD